MAETLTDPLTQFTRDSEVAAAMLVGKGRVAVYRYVRMDVDAAPSDTTIFEVPTGKTFYLTNVKSMTTNVSVYPIRLNDTKGNSATPATDARAVVLSVPTNYPIPVETFVNPIIFENGITIDSADTPASKSYWFIINGYVV